MNWKNLFVPVRNMNAAEARDYMAKRPSDGYQLLDVRQPGEYEQSHLPGAQLIPLTELPGRLDELQKEKPVIVYCAVGGRSKAAAQLLSGQDFAEIYNLSGGIKAWEGGTAIGPLEAGLDFFTGSENYEDGASLAYAMEDGLQIFYRTMADQSQDDGQKKLYARLAGFEERHKSRLLMEYKARHNGAALKTTEIPGIMEGGRRVAEFLEQAKSLAQSSRAIVDLAMMLETQAMDLYSRMARKSSNPETGKFFLAMADEEKTHLAFLAEALDRMVS